MNKFVRTSLMAAGILAAAGFALCLFSAAFGGRGLLYIAGNGGCFNKKTEEAGYKDQISADSIRRLDLQLGAGTFVIREKDQADGMIDIYVQYLEGFDYYVEGDTLCVEGFKDVRLTEMDMNRNVITLELPAGMYFDEVDMETGACVIEVNSLDAKKIDVSVGAGELVMNQIKAEELSVELGAGRVDAGSMYVKDVFVMAGIGDFVYEGVIENDLDAQCSMGSMDFFMNGEEEDHNYEIECSAGSINLDGARFSGLASEREIDNGARGTFKIVCNMGSVAISFDR